MKKLTLTTQASLSIAALIASSVLFAAPAVLAQSNQSTVAVDQKSTWDTVKEHLRLQYIGELTGPAMTGLHVPGSDGTAAGAINLDNKITAGYRFNRQWIADATLDFGYNPLGAKAGVIDPSITPFVMKDPFLRVSNSQLIHNDVFNLYSDLRVYLPVGDGSRANSTVLGLRNTLYSAITLPSSKWTFGHFSLLRVNAYNGVTNGKGDLFSALFSVHGSYQFTDNLALYLWSDLMSLGVDRPAAAASTDAVNLQAGVSWDINKVLNFNPYIKVLPGYLSLNTTSFNFVLTASIF